MGKIKGFQLNRKQYQMLRRLDHNQMTLWLEEFYQSAYRDGVNDSQQNSADLEVLKQEVMKIRGIGEKKADLIIEMFEDMAAKKS